MSWVLDATPTLINRTAISRIVLDTIRAFQTDPSRTEGATRVRFLFFRNDTLTLSAVRAKAVRWLFFLSVRRPVPFLALSTLLISAARQWSVFKKRGKPERTLFFDPLYALYHRDLDRSVVFVLDLTPLSHPDWHDHKVSLLYRAAFKRIAASRCHLISISKSTTADLRVNLGIHEDRISTLPLYLPEFGKAHIAIDETSLSARSSGSTPYFLFVGSLELRKNLILMVKAFGASGLAERGFEFWIVGGQGKGAEHILWEGKRTPGVKFLGYVSDEALGELYRNALGFPYLSAWEGFGVPLLEAMSRGVPCLATCTGASPEVGGDAVLYADPCDLSSIVHGFQKLATLTEDERRTWSQSARTRAQVFTFERYFSELKQILNQVSESLAGVRK